MKKLLKKYNIENLTNTVVEQEILTPATIG